MDEGGLQYLHDILLNCRNESELVTRSLILMKVLAGNDKVGFQCIMGAIYFLCECSLLSVSLGSAFSLSHKSQSSLKISPAGPLPSVMDNQPSFPVPCRGNCKYKHIFNEFSIHVAHLCLQVKVYVISTTEGVRMRR